MSAIFDPTGIERFRDIVTRQFGLNFDDAKLAFLGEVLARRAEATGRPEPASGWPRSPG